MKYSQFDVCIANLDPRFGTETGKTRPVVIVQTDLLNNIHPSSLICPITTNIKLKAQILRIHLKKGDAGVIDDCDIMVDQVRAIDNKRFIKKIGTLPGAIADQLKDNLKIVFDL